jgi:hypothetical protein
MSNKTLEERRAFLDRWTKEHREFDFELEDMEDEDLEQRYVVITIVEYDGQQDALETYWHDGLETSRVELENHLCQDARDGYRYDAAVLDLEEERELPWTKIEEVRWDDEVAP